MKLMPPLAALLFGVSTLSVSAASETAMPLTYETFEEAVPHVDLEACPASLAGSRNQLAS